MVTKKTRAKRGTESEDVCEEGRASDQRPGTEVVDQKPSVADDLPPGQESGTPLAENPGSEPSKDLSDSGVSADEDGANDSRESPVEPVQQTSRPKRTLKPTWRLTESKTTTGSTSENRGTKNDGKSAGGDSASKHPVRSRQIQLFPCPSCDKDFSKRFGLKRHMVACHKVGLEAADQKTDVADQETDVADKEADVADQEADAADQEVDADDQEFNPADQESNLDDDEISANSDSPVDGDYGRCRICKKTVKRRNMSEHMRTHSEQKKPFPCTVCKKDFWKKYSLKRHMLSIHPNETEETAVVLACDVCGKTYTHPSSLHYHKLGHKEKKHACKVCGLKVKTNGALKRHFSVHLGEIRCRVCRKIFDDLESLALHLETHTLDDFAKDESDQSSPVDAGKSGEGKKDDTMVISDGDEFSPGGKENKAGTEASTMYCGHCDDAFTDIHEMSRHFMKSHLDLLPEKAEKSLSKAASKIGTGGDKNSNPIKCGVCEKAFQGMIEMRHHIVKSHPELVSESSQKSAKDRIGETCEPEGFSTGNVMIEEVSCGHCDESFPILEELNAHIMEEHTESLSEAAMNALKLSRRIPSKPAGKARKKNLESSRAAALKRIRCKHCNIWVRSDNMHGHVDRNHPGMNSASPEKASDECGVDDSDKSIVRKKKVVKKRSDSKRSGRGDGDAGSVSVLDVITTCPHCGMSLKSYNLRSHVQRVHDKQLNATCEVCGKKFFNQCSLKRHHVAVHREQLSLNTPRYTCKTCGVAYTSRSSLHSHVQVKHKSTTYSCWGCGREFKELSILNKHVLLHDLNSVRCRLCRFIYKDWDRLKTHLARVHPEAVGRDIKEFGFLNKDRESEVTRKRKSAKRPRMVDSFHQQSVKEELAGLEDGTSIMVVEMDDETEEAFDIAIQMEKGATQEGDSEVPDVYLCQICNAGFHDSNTLIAHCVTVHPDTLRIVFE